MVSRGSLCVYGYLVMLFMVYSVYGTRVSVVGVVTYTPALIPRRQAKGHSAIRPMLPMSQCQLAILVVLVLRSPQR